MVAARIGTLFGVVGMVTVFGGCQMVGPIAIDAGRERYNSIIQSTTKQQAFANIVRVHNNEPTSFMDVTEVDATQTLSGTASGAITNIGAKAGTSGGTLAGEIGSFTPGVTYSEAPLIRYVPLIGQGLVEQLVAPINTDALASLYVSEWGLLPLFDLSMDFLTLDYDYTGAAINIMAELDYDGRLDIVSAQSDWTRPKNPPSGASDSGSGASNKKTTTSASPDDSLVIYYVRSHRSAIAPRDERGKTLASDDALWSWLLSLYAGTQAGPCGPAKKPGGAKAARGAGAGRDAAGADNAEVKKAVAQGAAAAAAAADAAAKATAAAAQQVADSAQAAASGAPTPPAPAPAKPGLSSPPRICPGRDSIELRTMAVTKAPNKFVSAAPLMRTFSALGVLKSAAQPPNPRIGFVPLDRYQRVRQYLWNDPDHLNPLLTTYTLRPSDVDQGDEKSPSHSEQKSDRINADGILETWLNDFEASHAATDRLRYVYDRGPATTLPELVAVNQRLEELRRYIFIIQSAAPPPPNAFVSYAERGVWYYIDGDDVISQRNFNLVVLFLTVMAYPASTAPLTTSISVGGG